MERVTPIATVMEMQPSTTHSHSVSHRERERERERESYLFEEVRLGNKGSLSLNQTGAHI